MKPAGYTVILVPSVSHALKLEKVLCAQGIPCRLIPVPRHLSSDCGVCVRIERADDERVATVLKATPVEIEGFHLL
ncbi:MAG: DUF3343 domain-containing protein [Chloroflexota bacterium]|nr:DUF3343 domain-containing protein [Chloroflexota bacterium]